MGKLPPGADVPDLAPTVKEMIKPKDLENTPITPPVIKQTSETGKPEKPRFALTK